MEEKNLKELQELVDFLCSHGWEAKACDTPVPYYDCGVVAGYPESPGDYGGEVMMLPKVPAGDLQYNIRARGDSMEDAGIDAGDILTVLATSNAEEGDIVIAYVNGEMTVKVYMLDKNGEPWLVPQNDKYVPIKLSETDDVRIMGKVISINKPAKLNLKECRRLFDRIAPRSKVELSEDKVRRAVREVAPMITINRQWYAVFRVLIDRGYYSGLEDIYTFKSDVAEWLPELEIKLDGEDLRKMAVQSFAKPVAFWEASDAPVYGKRFNDYLKIARSLNKAL